jgi:hypothetical protein
MKPINLRSYSTGRRNTVLYGTITKQPDSKEIMLNQFANFAGEGTVEYFGSLMNTTIS